MAKNRKKARGTGANTTQLGKKTAANDNNNIINNNNNSDWNHVAHDHDYIGEGALRVKAEIDEQIATAIDAKMKAFTKEMRKNVEKFKKEVTTNVEQFKEHTRHEVVQIKFEMEKKFEAKAEKILDELNYRIDSIKKKVENLVADAEIRCESRKRRHRESSETRHSRRRLSSSPARRGSRGRESPVSRSSRRRPSMERRSPMRTPERDTNRGRDRMPPRPNMSDDKVLVSAGSIENIIKDMRDVQRVVEQQREDTREMGRETYMSFEKVSRELHQIHFVLERAGLLDN